MKNHFVTATLILAASLPAFALAQAAGVALTGTASLPVCIGTFTVAGLLAIAWRDYAAAFRQRDVRSATTGDENA